MKRRKGILCVSAAVKAGVCTGVNIPFPEGISDCCSGALQGLLGHTCPAESVFSKGFPTLPHLSQPLNSNQVHSHITFPVLFIEANPIGAKAAESIKTRHKSMKEFLVSEPSVNSNRIFLIPLYIHVRALDGPTLLVLPVLSGHNLPPPRVSPRHEHSPAHPAWHPSAPQSSDSHHSAERRHRFHSQLQIFLAALTNRTTCQDDPGSV